MSNNTKFVNPTKVITGNCVFSYLNCWEAKALTEGQTPKFSVSLIIKKSDTKTIDKIKKAIEAAYKEGQSKLKGNSKTIPSLAAIKTPLRDGDTERDGDENYKGCYFVNANSTQKPGVVDVNLQPILERDEMYSGVIGKASISFYAFNSNGNRGIACSLNHLMKVKDGEPLGTRASAESDFATDDADDDFLD